MTDHTQVLSGSWRFRARSLTDTLLNFLFPPVCANCKKVGALVCADCAAQISWVVEPLCERCGRPLSHSAPHCYACTQRPFPLQQVRTAVFFEDPIQTLIHKLKYSNTFALASALAAFMLQAWPDWASPINCIIPIPLHEKRYKERGYNQSERLAHYLSHERHIWMDTHSLQRTRHTQPQVHLNAVERQSNVAGAFSVTDTDIVNKHILLIDDVFTTGATLSAAADVLLTAGAATVSGYCLARAK